MKPLAPVPTHFLADLIQGAADLVQTPAGLVPWRLPAHLAPFYHSLLLESIKATSGVRIHFQSPCRAFRLDFDQIGMKGVEPECVWDVFVNGSLHSRHTIPSGKNASLSVQDLPAENKEITVYLPTNAHPCLAGLAADAPVDRAAEPTIRWITHGSSLTHCRSAAGPGETWPAIVARAKGWHFRNLGFAGQCKFDPVVARTIAKLPADRISLCLGINTALGLYSLRTWVPAIEGFLMTVRDGHPETPLLIITPILSPPRETWDEEPCRIGLQTMRHLLAESVEKFRAAGDHHIHLFDGLRLIGPGDESTMPDELHPDADGIRLMADRFLQHMPDPWAAGA
jgi:hypothetical protein